MQSAIVDTCVYGNICCVEPVISVASRWRAEECLRRRKEFTDSGADVARVALIYSVSTVRSEICVMVGARQKERMAGLVFLRLPQVFVILHAALTQRRRTEKGRRCRNKREHRREKNKGESSNAVEVRRDRFWSHKTI